MITIERIKKNLQEAIKNSEKTQTEIANALRITQSMVSKYKRGEKIPSLDTFANLCIILDISADYLLGLTNEY